MTVGEMAQDVFEMVGEDERLLFRVTEGDPTSPINTASAGWTRLVRAMDRGQVAISRWKDPRTGRRLRWAGSTRMYNTETPATVAGTAGAGSTVTRIYLETTTYAPDYFEGWILEVGSERRTIALSGADYVVPSKPLTTAPTPSSTTYTLYAPYFALESHETVLRVSDMVNERDLDIVRPEYIQLQATPSFGNPTEFFQVGNKLHIAPVPNEGYFRVEVENNPSLSTDPNDSPELPEQFHYAIVLWTAVWGFGRLANPEMRTSLKQELRAYMREIQYPEDAQMDRQNSHMTVRTR